MEQIGEKLNGRANSLKALEETRPKGRALGSKNKATIVKEVALQNVEQKLLYDIIGLAQSQIDVARGICVMMVPIYAKVKNDKGKLVSRRTGKFRQETNPHKIMERLEDPEQENQEHYYYIYAKDPNPKALEDVMSRLFDRSKDKDSGGEDPFKLAFKNLFLNFTANNHTTLVNVENNAADPTKADRPRQIERTQPAPTNESGSSDILERLERAISKPNVEIESSVLD